MSDQINGVEIATLVIVSVMFIAFLIVLYYLYQDRKSIMRFLHQAQQGARQLL